MMSYFQNLFAQFTTPFSNGASGIIGAIFFILLLVWSLVWKGLALWRAARLGRKRWFIAILTINTFGILEILYLFVFSKKSKMSAQEAVENAP
ncbi:MAG: DUF5652 family protein [Candidatus Sungiibacteriota bacterium]